MENGKKAALGGTLVFLAVIGARVGMIYRERNAAEKPAPTPVREKIADDDLVFLKHKRQSTMEDTKELVGQPLWVSAGGQMEYGGILLPEGLEKSFVIALPPDASLRGTAVTRDAHGVPARLT